MNILKHLSPILALAALCASSCVEMEVPEAVRTEPQLSMTLGEAAFDGSTPVEVFKGESVAIAFATSGVSKVVADCTQGWSCEVSKSEGTITITAPEYSETSAPEEAQIRLFLYNGSTPEPSELSFKARAAYRPMSFSIKEDLAGEYEFSLGSQCVFTFEASESVKDFEFSLPEGWTAERKEDGTIVVTAPDLTLVSGDPTGDVVITPVSWSGEKGASLQESIKVKATFNPTFQFEDTEVSFDFGQTKTLKTIVKGIKSVTAPALPKGWKGDFSKMKDGEVTLTAPAQASDFEPVKDLTVEGMSVTDETVESSACRIRLLGINSTEEFLDFRKLYGATENEPNTKGLDKYLYGGEISLNADISLPESAMASVKAYFIKYLVLPLNGNGRTITMDFKSTLGVAALFQYIKTPGAVRNLKLAGKLSNTTSAKSYCAPLAARMMSGVSIENIDCDVDVTFKGTDPAAYAGWVGGVVAYAEDDNTFKNVRMTGDIEIINPLKLVGGICGQPSTSKLAKPIVFEDCEFAGKMTYTQQSDNTQNPRIGGITGDCARYDVFTRCKFTGSMVFNLNGYLFQRSNGCGVGGIGGRITAPASGYTMKFVFTDCQSSGSIVVNNPHSGDIASQYGLILGTSPSSAATAVKTETGSVVTGSVKIN